MTCRQDCSRLAASPPYVQAARIAALDRGHPRLTSTAAIAACVASCRADVCAAARCSRRCSMSQSSGDEQLMLFSRSHRHSSVSCALNGVSEAVAPQIRDKIARTDSFLHFDEADISPQPSRWSLQKPTATSDTTCTVPSGLPRLPRALPPVVYDFVPAAQCLRPQDDLCCEVHPHIRR